MMMQQSQIHGSEEKTAYLLQHNFILSAIQVLTQTVAIPTVAILIATSVLCYSMPAVVGIM